MVSTFVIAGRDALDWLDAKGNRRDLPVHSPFKIIAGTNEIGCIFFVMLGA